MHRCDWRHHQDEPPQGRPPAEGACRVPGCWHPQRQQQHHQRVLQLHLLLPTGAWLLRLLLLVMLLAALPE